MIATERDGGRTERDRREAVEEGRCECIRASRQRRLMAQGVSDRVIVVFVTAPVTTSVPFAPLVMFAGLGQCNVQPLRDRATSDLTEREPARRPDRVGTHRVREFQQ